MHRTFVGKFIHFWEIGGNMQYASFAMGMDAPGDHDNDKTTESSLQSLGIMGNLGKR